MSKADFTRVHRAPTADKACGRNTVMGTAEGPVPRQQAINVLAQNRMDTQRLLLILNGKLGQDAGHTTREHRLARSRDPIMSKPSSPAAASAMPRLATSCPSTSA